jgi:pyridoxamine 5'-phosphate oxidase
MNIDHSFEELDRNPLQQFQAWFAEAGEAGVPMVEAMALATTGSDGRPSVRMVLLKQADERGFGFHTHYESRKGLDLVANPHAALLFYWQPLGRQVRIEGVVERIAAEESASYFRTRPLGSRIAAWASPQSRPLRDRAELERLYAEAQARFEGGEVPLPPHWGGFRLAPDAYEFWQHADNRLHDRLRYRRDGESWRRERLAP